MVISQRKKKFFYLLAIPAIILLVLSGLLYLYINSENFRENVRSLLITQLENSLGKRIEIGTVNSISFQSLQLTRFTLFENSSDEKNNILFQAEQAKAEFVFLFSLFQWKNWQLDIQEITFYQASADLIRESSGEFDIIKKLDLELDEIQQNLIIHHIHFQDSQLVFQDELVYNYNLDYLTTRAKNINGYFDLSQLPKIIFDFQGIREIDNSLLSLKGQFLVNQPEYSLDFHLENADITHFQYYLEVAEQFEVSKGEFDLDLNISFSPEFDSVEPFWQGNASFRQVDIKPHFLQQIPFYQIRGTAQFVKPEITVSELQVFYLDRPVQLRGLVLTEPEVYFNLDIESEAVDAYYLKNDLALFIPDYTDFSLQGKLDLTVNLKGSPEDFQIEGKIFSSDIFVEDIPFQKSDLSFSLQHERLIIHSLNAYDSGSSLTINGQIDWSEDIPFYWFALKTKNLSLQHALFNQLSFFEDSKGNIDGDFQIESQKQDSSIISIEGQLTVNSIKIKEASLPEPLQGNIKAILNLPGTRLSIEECELESGQNNGFLNGEIHFDELIHFSMDFGFQVPELTELANSLGIEMQPAGRAEIEGIFYGTLEEPEAHAEFHLQEFSVQDYMPVELTGQLVYQKDTITLETFALTNQDIKLTGNGIIVLHKSGLPEIELSYQLPAIALDLFIQTMTGNNIPLSGQTTGNGQIQGIWPELTIQGNFQLDQVTYQDYLLGQGELGFNLHPEQSISSDYIYSLDLENFNLQNETMKMTAEGQLKITEDHPFSLQIDFAHQSLNDIIEYFYPIDNNLKNYLPSQITGKVHLNGDLSEQQILLSAQLMPLQQQNNPPSQLESVIIKNDQGFTISDFHLIQSEGHFKAEGNISPTQVLDINFQAEQLDMDILMGLAQIDETMKGILNIEGSFKGTINQPRVFMTSQIKQGYFRGFQFENLQSDIHWDSKTNEIEVRKLAIALESDYEIQAKGNFPLGVFFPKEQQEIITEISYPEIPLDFQITMEKANLNILRLFWKDTFSEVMGKIDLELNLTGTSENPIVNGAIEVHQGNMILNDLPVRIEDLNTRIEILNNQVTIPPIPFAAYENLFNLSGQFTLTRLLPENMVLTIQNIEQRIIYQNILESEADFLAEIRGSFLDPQINGNFLLSRGELNLDQLMQLYEEENVSLLAPTSPGASQGSLDMNIEIADPFTLSLTNAEINITGAIRLNGSFTEPSVQGNLVLRKGYLIYFEKRFVISEGRVGINGFTINDIDINARAQTNVQDVQIMISISGNLANPQIRLSSQPPLRETEILSLLTFDRNIQGLSEGEIDQLLSQEMIDIIFQSLQINLFKRMERELAEGLGLEFFRLSYDTSGNSGSQIFFLEDLHIGDLTLEIGKSIGDDLLITYSTPLDFHGETSLGIDYQISSDFKFSTQFDTYSIRDEDYRFKFGLEINF